jgi:hypothetical protein
MEFKNIKNIELLSSDELFDILKKFIRNSIPTFDVNDHKMDSIKNSNLLYDVSKKCWNFDYEKRPNFLELLRILVDLKNDFVLYEF